MIIDHMLQVSNEQVVTVTAPSVDVIDFGQVRPNTGMNNMLSVVVTVDQTALAAGAATVSFAVQDSADNVTFTDIVATAPIPRAQLTIGRQIVIGMPVIHRRFVRLNYVVATGPLTAGRFSAQVVTGIQSNSPYPGVL